MDRSLYPEGVEVHQRHLENTESTKITALKQEAVDVTSRGVVSGLGVTINGGDNTRFDVALGYGYVPNGDFLRLTSNQTAIALANNTLGIQNYVILMYDELASSPEAHETDGTTRNTRASNSPRVVVLTAAQYTALPATDAVLSNNAKDRALLLAIITASGGSITVNNIQNPTIFRNVLQTSQPFSITGVVIIGIDSATSTGTGTLSYNSGTKTLTWQAPGEGGPGVGTVFTTSGIYIVTSLAGRTLQLNVLFSLLPTTNQVDVITITNIYGQVVPRLSAVDAHHRSYLGTGIPTSTNPHGMTLDDLSPGAQGTLEEHQDIMHANGITRISSPTLLTGAVATGPAPDTASFTSFAAGDTVYINGRRVQAMASSNVISFSDGTIEPATYGVYLGQDGNLYKTTMARFPATGISLLFAKVQILNVVGIVSGTYNLTWTTAGNLQLNGGPTIAAPTAAPDHIIRVYNVDRIGYMDLFVKGTAAPGVNQTDAIVVFTQPDAEENLPAGTIAWSGSATGFAGAGFGIANAPNFIYDTRIFGTLEEEDTRFDAGMIDAAKLVSENMGDGILVRSRAQSGSGGLNEVTTAVAIADSFFLGVLAFPNVPLTGGVVYVGGHRWEIKGTTLVMTNNTTNRIYVDGFGVLQTSILTWAQIEANESSIKHRPFQRLWDLAIAAGAETSRTSLREYTNHKHDQQYGVVGLNINKQALISTVAGSTGDSLGVLTNGTGTGVQVTQTSSGVGVNITASSGAALNAYSEAAGYAATVTNGDVGGGLNVIAGAGQGLNVYSEAPGFAAVVTQGDVGKGLQIITASNKALEAYTESAAGVYVATIENGDDGGGLNITTAISGIGIKITAASGKAIEAYSEAATFAATIENGDVGGGLKILTGAGKALEVVADTSPAGTWAATIQNTGDGGGLQITGGGLEKVLEATSSTTGTTVGAKIANNSDGIPLEVNSDGNDKIISLIGPQVPMEDAVANAISRSNLIRAWVDIPDATSTTGPDISGFGIASVTTNSSGHVTVTFATNQFTGSVAGDNLMALITFDRTNVSSGQALTYAITAFTTSSLQFDVYLAGSNTLINFSTQAYGIHVAVIGWGTSGV